MRYLKGEAMYVTQPSGSVLTQNSVNDLMQVASSSTISTKKPDLRVHEAQLGYAVGGTLRDEGGVELEWLTAA